MENKFIDLKGVRCPMPIFKINKEMNEISTGQILKAVADDPAFKPDIEAYSQMKGHEIVSLTQEGKETTVFIKKI
ncbi:MAG: hypothetical protein A2046_11650 [Bacteroidetes bacterium GWA2_30_7]|nr:MAG: hypothetical protein A2046_11650 [Bacteroidetes bacterium GWA2_30_7]